MAKGPKPNKPYVGFPLTAHPRGNWCKKIKGKLCYFGPWDNPQAALEKYLQQRDDLQAGRTPRITTGSTTLADCCNSFLAGIDEKVRNGELAARTFDVYRRGAKGLVEFFGRLRPVSDLRVDDFQRLRTHLAKGRGLVSLANEIRVIRIILNHFNDDLSDRMQSEETEDKPVWIPKAFRGPKRDALIKARNAKPARMLTAEQLRSVLAVAGLQLRAMCLLGINCGFGQTDISMLPESSVDLCRGWIDFPRPKTGVQRRAPLWPGTIEALRQAFAKRPAAKHPEAMGKAFVTKYGSQFVRSKDLRSEIDSIERLTQIDSIALEFGKLLTKLDLKRPGLNFYCLRHTFETVAGESRDQVSVDFLMGHSPHADDMSAVYREGISDDRLQSVGNVVRLWLWPAGSEAEQVKIDAVATNQKSDELAIETTKPKATRKKRAQAK